MFPMMWSSKPSFAELLSKYCCQFNDKFHKDEVPPIPYYRQRTPQLPQWPCSQVYIYCRRLERVVIYDTNRGADSVTIACVCVRVFDVFLLYGESVDRESSADITNACIQRYERISHK